MTLDQALAALKPLHPEVPTEALKVIRTHWDEAEPVLLAEIDRRIAQPLAEDNSALFLYALYLCAEMRSSEAFLRYMEILRLPNLLLDILIGDVLTEDMKDFLARTCADRNADLKTVIEDETINEYARSAAIRALQELVAARELSQAEMQQYCIELLEWRLERRPSHAWDMAVSMAEELHVKDALPLIEVAYQQGLADSGFQSLEEVKSGLSRSSEQVSSRTRRKAADHFDTAYRLSMFARNWSPKDISREPDPDELLQGFRAARQQKTPPKGPKIGRNEPCPCGSGKKYKKCCLGRKQLPSAVVPPAEAAPPPTADEWIGAGYYYLEMHQSHHALTCWWSGWQAARTIIPIDIQDPVAEECDRLFAECDFFANWLQDYQSLLEENLKFNADAVQDGVQFCQQVLGRFPAMDIQRKFNLMATKTLLLLALGRAEEAFTLPAQMIKEQPCKAQGYVISAELLSLDAQRFNLRADLERARQLLLQARQHATDCDDWDVQARLEELNHCNP